MSTAAKTAYEPRVLWDVQAAASDSSGAVRAEFDRRHLKNDETCPIQLTHMLVSPLECTFEALSGIYDDEYSAAVSYFIDRKAILDQVRISLGVPGRPYWTAAHVPLATLGGVPTFGPPSVGLGLPQPLSQQMAAWGRSASIYQTLRWTFPTPLHLPSDVRYEFALSAYALPPLFDGVISGVSDPDVFATIGFTEEAPPGAGLPFPGRVIVSDRFELEQIARSPFPEATETPEGSVPSSASVQSALWPGTSRHTTVPYDRDHQARLRGFSVHLDPLDYEDIFGDGLGTPSDADFLIASLADKIATKAHIRNAGTMRRWWRDGAPLSLVCPSSTPAVVVPFRQPITLAPMDGIDVEMLIPTFSTGLGNVEVNLGISFAGFLASPKETR